MQREKNTKTLDDFLVISVFFLEPLERVCKSVLGGWMESQKKVSVQRKMVLRVGRMNSFNEE